MGQDTVHQGRSTTCPSPLASSGWLAGKRLCADIDGWSLHAAVTVHADDDEGGENLCRYILRHPITLQRLSMTRDGRVAYRINYPRGKGPTW